MNKEIPKFNAVAFDDALGIKIKKESTSCVCAMAQIGTTLVQGQIKESRLGVARREISIWKGSDSVPCVMGYLNTKKDASIAIFCAAFRALCLQIEKKHRHTARYNKCTKERRKEKRTARGFNDAD